MWDTYCSASWQRIERAGLHDRNEGVAFYLFVYGFMTIGAFAVVIVLQRQGSSATNWTISTPYRRSPASAVVLLIFMLSLAGFRVAVCREILYFASAD